MAMDSAATADASDYERHWSKWHSNHPGTEWHLDYHDVRDVLRPFLASVRREDPCQIVDLGCGTSSFGLHLLEDFPEAHLTLVDVSEQLVADLKALYATEKRVSCVVGDCRDEEALPSLRHRTTLVIDKGTVDALHHSSEKVQMLKAAVSLLQPNGIIVSISFATATQVLLLRRLAPDLGLKLAQRVVKVQNEVRLVSLLGGWDDSAADSGNLEMIRRELDRLLYSSPLRGEPRVVFENPGLARPISVEQEVEKDRSGEDCTGCIVWPSAHAMCAHLCAYPELVRGKRVVELGAGTGLVGLVCAALGAAEVVLTDLSQGLPLLKRNVQLNLEALGGATRVAELKWGKEASMQVVPQGCDVVVGCEVIYQHDDETSAALVETMRHLAGKDGCCLMAYEFRDGLMQDAVFFDAANAAFEVSAQSLAEYGFGLTAEDCGDRMLYTYHAKVPLA